MYYYFLYPGMAAYGRPYLGECMVATTSLFFSDFHKAQHGIRQVYFNRISWLSDDIPCLLTRSIAFLVVRGYQVVYVGGHQLHLDRCQSYFVCPRCWLDTLLYPLLSGSCFEAYIRSLATRS